MAEQQVIRPRVLKSYTVPTDPLFDTQWNVVSFFNMKTCLNFGVLNSDLYYWDKYFAAKFWAVWRAVQRK